MRIGISLLGLALMAAPVSPAREKTKKAPPPSAVDDYVRETTNWYQTGGKLGFSPGSIYSSQSRFADLTRDMRASQIGDLVTIVVLDSASAVSTGATSTSRKASASASVTSLAGMTSPTGPLTNMANLGGQSKLDGQGTTSRKTTLTTTLSARVTNVLPNGYLVVEGDKDVAINSEHQTVQIRGVLRWNDLSPNNQISSNSLAALEIRINGKGVVGDAIRRPNFLYRLLLGILPF